MKFVFLVIAILFNFFNHSLLNSEEELNSNNNKVDNITNKDSITKVKTGIRKIHIVKVGDTISSISRLYLINKDLIIKLNNLNDENYIFVGQNLIVSEPNINSTNKSDLIINYHIVQIGENLTEISNKYNLNLEYLKEINNLKNPDSIKIGEKLLLSKNNTNSSDNSQIIKNKENNELPDLEKKVYGPILIQSKFYENKKGRKVLNVLNQDNKKLILSINCDKNELNIRVPGRKWRGEESAKEKFEKDLINDFC